MHKHVDALLTAFLIFLFVQPAFAGDFTATANRLVTNGGYLISRDNRVLYAADEQQLFSTASTIKILTALTVLKTLGEDYRYTTHIYYDDRNTLYIRGSGDPHLTSEAVRSIVAELKNKGVKTISSYVLDDSLFMLRPELPEGSENSLNPYDAPNGALAVNYNSIAILKYKNGKIKSGEEQTPTLPLTKELGALLPPGNQRINIHHFPLPGRLSPQLRYSAELFHALAVQAGINSTLRVRKGLIPARIKPITVFKSPNTLADSVRLSLKFSNNFSTNQLLLTAAAHRYGRPATWGKARDLLADTARKRVGLREDQYRVVEGSGLSRKNKMSAQAMNHLLKSFYPYRHLLSQKYGVPAKTGTMESVYCLSGYLDNFTPPVFFTFLLNQETNDRHLLLQALRSSLGRE